jgi:FMN reductase
MPRSVVGLSGSLRRPSRTSALVGALLAAIDERLGTNSRLIEFADAAPVLFGALSRNSARTDAEALIRMVEDADILVVGTPVYRASYTGALKHLFDLVRHDALVGKPAILAATGGSQLHGLMTEHQLRPLLSFFNAITIPTTVYATEDDFNGGHLVSAAVFDRIGRAADDLRHLISRPPDVATAPAPRYALLAAGR